MFKPIMRITEKIEIIIKDGPNNRIKVEYENSTLEIKTPFLLIHQDDKSAITTKIFDMNDIYSYKEHYKITKQNKKQ